MKLPQHASLASSISRVCLILCLTLVCLSWLTLSASAQYRSSGIRNGVVTVSMAERYGLERAWLTQVEVDRSQARIAHVSQHVSTTNFYTVFEVKDEFATHHFSEQMADRFGQPIGIEGAKQLAKDMVQKIKDNGGDTFIKPMQIPVITLLVQTDRATLHALDAATGRTMWVSGVGNRKFPTLEPAGNDDVVCVINGSTLYVLDRANGKEMFSRSLSGAPGAGPAVTEDRVFVPLINGSMEVYSLEESRRPAWRHASTGRLLVRPTTATNSVSWATARGYLYVGHRDRPGVRFRLEARDAIVAPATFLPPNRLFAGSIDGYVYCVHEFNGDVLWRYSCGDPISTTPVVTQDAVYALADDAGLYKINSNQGIQEWWAPRIRNFVTASNNRVYCVGYSGQMIILDAKTGGRIDTMPLGDINLTPVNWQTDRLFVGTDTGVLQCLYETGQKWPTVHNVPDPETSGKPKVVQQREEEPEVKPEDGGDPFGGGDDPFGGGDDPFGGGGDDPFGAGGDDPFGGGGDAGDDPFGGGGGDDPFGGGGGADDPFGGGGDDNPFG